MDYSSNHEIEQLISAIDITPKMYEQAKTRYHSLADMLENQGIDAEFYPQGSFRMGTVVKPYFKGEDKSYDLDVVAEIGVFREDTDAKTIKHLIGDTIKSAPRFEKQLKPEDNRCWTLSYVSDGFELDIVPSVMQSKEYVNQLISKGVRSDCALKAIAITDKKSEGEYAWTNSNPQGYAKWFDEINEPFLRLTRQRFRESLMHKSRGMFASVEEIPSLLERSSLQRVIQIMKRHRDVYFTGLAIKDDSIWDLRPISAIITTLCVQIASHIAPTSDILDLLSSVSCVIREHASLQNQVDSWLFESRRQQTYIRKRDSKWRIVNPVDPNDNYTENWTDNHTRVFFQWLDKLHEDFFVDLPNTLSENRSLIYKNLFGKRIVEQVFPEESSAPYVAISTGTKPYKEG
ncbi:MAG: nucleotidyltransferase [Gallicola sp.]|nr:nucleotidyltransferase [Gallicola sp.]